MKIKNHRRSGRISVILMVVLFLAGGLIAYLGVQEGLIPVPTNSPIATEPLASGGSVYRIILPHDELAIPPGPNREVFQASCTVCHSPRLVFTQPSLTEKQWDASVEKMIKVYGAPVSEDQKTKIMAYLTATLLQSTAASH